MIEKTYKTGNEQKFQMYPTEFLSMYVTFDIFDWIREEKLIIYREKFIINE